MYNYPMKKIPNYLNLTTEELLKLVQLLENKTLS